MRLDEISTLINARKVKWLNSIDIIRLAFCAYESSSDRENFSSGVSVAIQFTPYEMVTWGGEDRGGDDCEFVVIYDPNKINENDLIEREALLQSIALLSLGTIESLADATILGFLRQDEFIDNMDSWQCSVYQAELESKLAAIPGISDPTWSIPNRII